jgi:hypothetical protein
VQMYALGVPVTVVVDDIVPFTKEGEPHFAKPTAGKGLWVMLLEKAFAKYTGSYIALKGYPGYQVTNGLAIFARAYFTGAPLEKIRTYELEEEDFWFRFSQLNDNIGATFSLKDENPSRKTKGLWDVLGAYELSDGTRLVKVSNGGDSGYSGDWDANSALWTDVIKQQVNYDASEDAHFESVYEVSRRSKTTLLSNFGVEGYHHSYWINLGRTVSSALSEQE